MSAGVFVGGAVLAIALIAIPGEPDPGYTAGCTDAGAAVQVEPDTYANRQAANAWCEEQRAFLDTGLDQVSHLVNALWGQR